MITETFISNVRLKKVKKETSTSRESIKRSVLKAISWRIIGTLDTISIAWILTAEVFVAVSIGSIELVTKMILYFFHDRAWSRLNWGINNTKQ